MNKIIPIRFGVVVGLLVSSMVLGSPGKHPSTIIYPKLDWKVPLGIEYRRVLNDSIVAYIARDTSLPLVAITGYIKSGTLFDPLGKEGCASFAVHMMRTGGTKKYSADALDARLEQFAIKLGLSASESQVEFSCSFLPQFTDTALEVLEQVLVYPIFDVEKIKLEKSLALEDIQHRFDNPAPILDAAFDKFLYPRQLSSRLVTEKSLTKLTQADLIQYHKQVFTGSNMIIAASGSIDTTRIKQAFGSWFIPGKTNAFTKNFSNNPKPDYTLVLVHKPQATQTYVQIGIPFIKRPTSEYYPMSVGNLILGGGGFNSRLATKVRSDEGLTYSIRSEAGSNYIYPSTISISFFTKNKSLSRALMVTLSEINKLLASGITDDELVFAKKTLLESFPSMFRSPNDIVKTYAWNEFYGRSPYHFKTYEDSINTISKKDVSAVLSKYLIPSKFTYVIVGDTSEILKNDTLADFKVSKLAPRFVTIADSIPYLP